MSKGQENQRKWAWRSLYVVVLLLTGPAIYANALSGPFIFDDIDGIVDNPHIRRLWPPSNLLSAPPNTIARARPVVSFTLAVNYALGGLEPAGYRVLNIAVHTLASVVLFGVIRHTLLTPSLKDRFARSADGLAFACALIWLVHPIQSECINYVSQRTESLMGLFYFLTFYCAARGLNSARRGWWHVAAVAACALGMASKQVMVTAPAMVLLYDAVFAATPWRETVRRRWGLYAGLAGTWVLLAALMFAYPDTNIGYEGRIGPADYALNQCVVIVDYLRRILWPHPLNVDYGNPEPRTLVEVLPHGIILAVVLVGASVLFIRRPKLGFGGLWFFVILSPTSSIVPMATEVGAERRVYVPLAGLVALAVIGGYLLIGRLASRTAAKQPRRAKAPPPPKAGWPAVLIVAVLSSALAWGTVRRNEDYDTHLSLWSTVVDVAPENYRGWNNLGIALIKRGRIEEAIPYLRRALELNPEYPEAHNHMGMALRAQGETDQALRHYRLALQYRPDFPECHYNFANALLAVGAGEQAVAHYQQALKLEPDYADAHFNLGNALVRLGRLEQAAVHYRRVTQLEPSDASAYFNLGVVLAELGRTQEAIEPLRRAVALDPNHARARQRLQQLLQASP